MVCDAAGSSVELSLDDSGDLDVDVHGVRDEKINHTVFVLVVLRLQFFEAHSLVALVLSGIDLFFFLQSRLG